MERQWTRQQSEVISSRNQNVLVSAAAGSGKTAVLVERILRLITNEEHPVDIDRLVVVTFTNAAAAEMKERIRNALEARIEADPGNGRLMRQMTMVGHAKISTIDSFCLNLLREHFLEAGIDPSFRTADGGEIQLLETEVLEALMEEAFASGDEAFRRFVDCYSPGRSDRGVEKLILALYAYSRSYPWPEEWLESCISNYEIKEEDDLDTLAVTSFYMAYLKDIFKDYEKKYNYAIALCGEEGGPAAYGELLLREREVLQKVLAAESFTKLFAAVKKIDFDRLPPERGKTVSEEMKEQVKAVREQYKKFIKEIRTKIFAKDISRLFAELKSCGEAVKVLAGMAIRMLHAMDAAKKEKNVIDFNDMEHLALNLLVKKDEGRLVYTETADRLSRQYYEIMIDEYQDSSYLQEYILSAVSGERFARPNMFMVGDVKQSIYGFRQARPELFVEKYRRYEREEEKNGKRIRLQMNFRSRGSVLEAVNDIFYQVMQESMGGIGYDDGVRLNAGLTFPEEQEGRAGGRCELCLVETKGAQEAEKTRAEAIVAARRIQELMDSSNGQLIYDKEEKTYRPALFGDIVILLRSDGGRFDIFADVFMDAGIPVSVQAGGGYFDSREVRTVLSVLSVIDNPLQDIPMAAAALSYFGGLTCEELALCRAKDKKKHVYENLQEEGSQKAARLLEKICGWRRLATLGSLYDVLWELIYQSGYYEYAGSMPAGEKRKANLDALAQKAREYEGTGIKGLFNFLRYIEKIRRYHVEYAEAASAAFVDAVRIMTIHKSKGLEFPIVFLCGLSKKINTQDLKSNVIIDGDLGLGTMAFSLESRTKTSTFYREALIKRQWIQTLSEEIRILYVALTRAKEKLILTGEVGDGEGAMEKYELLARRLQAMESAYLFTDLEACGSLMDLVVPAAIRNPADFQISIIPFEEADLAPPQECGEGREAGTKNKAWSDLPAYPWEPFLNIRGNMSVSEIKKLSYDYEEEPIERPQPMMDIPEFSDGAGADRGTAYHRVMECLDYGKALDEKGIVEQIAQMEARHKLTREQAEAVCPADILRFVESDLGRRVREAALRSELYRERPFVMGVPASEIVCYREMKGCEQMILVQGVIDLYFRENGKLVLVDYKTDRVSPKNGKEILASRYKTQMEYYAKALESQEESGARIKEKWIYAFSLGDWIAV